MLLSRSACTTACTADFDNRSLNHAFMKADWRISVKDYRWNKHLKVQLTQVPFARARQFWVRMNGVPWLKPGQPVSVTRLMAALWR